MAGSITLGGQINAAYGGQNAGVSVSGLTYTQTGYRANDGFTQTSGSAGTRTGVPMGDVPTSAACWVQIINLDPSNTMTVYNASSGGATIGTIPPGTSFGPIFMATNPYVSSAGASSQYSYCVAEP